VQATEPSVAQCAVCVNALSFNWRRNRLDLQGKLIETLATDKLLTASLCGWFQAAVYVPWLP
jgi:hypothetical protein